MKEKTIIIIGAGIAGLSAGCYGQMNGYQTQIFERHDKPGGLCTSWKRKSYIIEGGFHGLAGSSTAIPFHTMWSELLDMSSISFISDNMKDVFEFEDGNRFYLYSNLDRLEKYIKGIAPEDSQVIDEFIAGVRHFRKFRMPIEKPRELYGIRDYLKMLKYLPMLSFMRKWLNTSADEFAGKFKNPLLRNAMRYLQSPVLYEMMVLWAMDLKASGYPTCGVLEFANLIKKRYLSLGGEVHYNSKVTKILTKDHTAMGIETDDGKQYISDIVISAADGKTTIDEMLGGRYTNKKLAELYANTELNTSRVLIYLGVDSLLDDISFKTKYILNEEKPFVIADGTSYKSIDLLKFSNLPHIVPPNKSLVRIELETRGDQFWTRLREDRKNYLQVKEMLASDIIAILDKRLRGIKNKIDMIDVVTPATFIRYTGNWRGSIQGWQSENIFKSNPFKKKLKGLLNFYMCGQWVEPGGGVPTAALSGRTLIQIICKQDKRPFVTSNA
ncbi:phytoene desaturase family protein [Chloroflexota bacterium]